MELIEKILYLVIALIIVCYLPSFFEIDSSAKKKPPIRTYKIFNHIISVSKVDEEVKD